MSRSHPSPSRVARTTRAARAWLACAWLCVLAMLGACGGEPPTPLRVATNNWPGHWPLYLAHHRGQLDARLQELSSATEVLRAFRNHRIDVGAFTIEEFLQLLDEGNDPHVLLVVDYSNGADSVIARPPLASVADLRGHVIGTESTAMGAYVLRRTLESAGLTESDVKVVASDFGDHENAYTSGLVDAVVTFEPTRSRLLALGGKEVFSSASIPGEIVDVLVVNSRTARERAPELRKLVEAWYTAAQSVDNDPDSAADSLASMTQLNRAQFRQAMGGVHLVTRDENQELLQGGLSASVLRLAETMRGAGLLSHAFTEADIAAHISRLALP